MVARGEDELICDFAETYGILDMWALPVPLLATLACGLRDDSRIKMKISGAKVPTDTILLAKIVDWLGLLGWIESGSARQKNPRPASIEEILVGARQKQDNGLKQFRTSDDFQKNWAELTGK